MKTLLFTLALLTVSLTSFAQFASFGARWSFEDQRYAYSVNGYATINYEKDTLVDGVSSQQLKVAGQYVYNSGPGQTDTSNLQAYGYLHLHKIQDSVFTYREGAFHLAFKTNAVKGDIWNLGPFSGSMANDPRAFLKVDSVYTKMYDGLLLREIMTKPCDSNGVLVDFSQPPQNQNDFRSYVVYGAIINEKFGPMTNFSNLNYGASTNIIDETIATRILCYEDDNFSNHKFQPNKACKMNLNVGLTSLESSVPSIYPIPASSFVTIELNDPSTTVVELIDVYGKVLTIKMVYQLIFDLDLREFPEGIYFLRISNETQNWTKTILKIY
jgi:hypothetical protein